MLVIWTLHQHRLGRARRIIQIKRVPIGTLLQIVMNPVRNDSCPLSTENPKVLIIEIGTINN